MISTLKNAIPLKRLKVIKEGTMEEYILAWMRSEPERAVTIAVRADRTPKETSRALNSLRASGHVVSEGPGRILLWRLVP